jgi:phospholipid/cholesterol/gamma-HCH transport system permease protein
VPTRSSTLATADPRLDVVRESDGKLRVRVSGRWTLVEGLPPIASIGAALEETPRVSRVVFEPAGLEAWDSALVAFLFSAAGLAAEKGVGVDAGALPEGVRRLLDLSRAVPRRVMVPVEVDDALTARVGRAALHSWGTAQDALEFLGETALAGVSFVRGRARFRREDLLYALEASGAAALGIVALINFLIGAVLAFVGAVQLQQFGAAIYVADLVAIAVTRELGALMTGIVMAGRTGAAFAAVLGTMTVNEEVDALRTMGLRPAEFLVVPRVVATALMLPCLVAYADVLGIFGGTFVGVTMLGLSPVEYFRATQDALGLSHVVIGLVKSVAFGVVVALTGCYYGIRCGRSAAAVGDATTRAVVVGIILVVVVDAVFTVVLHVMRL